ncbi:MAG: patatin-like phospholipase family protein [Betaproteobacteria bacterium]
MKALSIYAGPRAFEHIQRHGLQPQDVGVIPGAAGGPKGLILGPLDRFVFGDWLSHSTHEVHLVGASIGAWRMATACLVEPAQAFARLEHDYVHQHYELQPGQARPTADFVSARFAQSLQQFFGSREHEVLQHPRYRLHIVTSRGRHLLRHESAWRTPLGYLGAFVSNAVSRRALGAWLERVVFSSSTRGSEAAQCVALPLDARDYRTRQLPLTKANFMAALQASCSIPFVLRSVSQIAGAPAAAYWDGGITDYHLHLDYAGTPGTPQQDSTGGLKDGAGRATKLVLYPHFQRAVVPGWLDKGLRWRHRASAFLDTTVLLVPQQEWVKKLPNGKLPDRGDFTHYGADLAGRMRAWRAAIAASGQLSDEFQSWLQRCNGCGNVELHRL